jgi:hypothetical protein
MNKDLRLLLISLFFIVVSIAYLYWNHNYECTAIKYQDVQGTHTTSECHKKQPETCWDKYATEALAIQMCEGK